MPSRVVLGTQIENIKMRSSKLIIKCLAQKEMTIFGFGHRYHDLEYFELGTFFHIP
jgi:hypothetical protein